MSIHSVCASRSVTGGRVQLGIDNFRDGQDQRHEHTDYHLLILPLTVAVLLEVERLDHQKEEEHIRLLVDQTLAVRVAFPAAVVAGVAHHMIDSLAAIRTQPEVAVVQHRTVHQVPVADAAAAAAVVHPQDCRSTMTDSEDTAAAVVVAAAAAVPDSLKSVAH